MDATSLERSFRRFLLILVEFMCVGTVFELILEKHYKELDQLIPFVLVAAAFVVTLVVLIRPQRNTILALRVVMVVVILGSLFGGYEHLKSNLEVVTDMLTDSTPLNSFLTALSGAAPLMAPGILALAGFLAIGGTMHYPGLRETVSVRPSLVRPARQLDDQA